MAGQTTEGNTQPTPPVTQEKSVKEEETLIRPLEEKEPKIWMKRFGITLGAVLIIGAGIATGNILVGQKGGEGIGGEKPKLVKTEKVVGSTDTKTFRDSAEGVLEKGGIDGEGTHHLTREGGPSQTAYLTSTVIDLNPYVGKKVKVFGETFTAQKAGWLMDIGKIEILE